jgi:DNA-binding response OmpR family regulator
MQTVLLLEDDSGWLRIYRRELEKVSVMVIEATGIADARKLLASQSVDIIVVDGELQDARIADTCAFVVQLRADGFVGQMIAASSDATWREKLVAAGCNHNYSGMGKDGAIIKLMHVIHLPER